MDRNTILKVGVFGALVIYVLPIFLDAVKPYRPVFTVVAGAIGIMSVIYFVAYDQINALLDKNKSFSNGYRNNRLTPQEAFEQEKQKLENELLLEKQKFEIAKQKAEIAKIKQGNRTNGDLGFGSGKMPDVLGNIGAVVSGDQSKPKKEESVDLDRIRGLF